MKIKTILLALLFFNFSMLLSADENQDVKTGWNFGALPAVSFNSDLGFQYGGLINLFNYGDGSRYPNYEHMLYFEISRYTKGSGLFRFSYDSEVLIPGIRLTFDASYMPEQAISFLGFNGFESVYNPDWEDDEITNDYKSRMFYKQQRNMWRVHTDVSGPLYGEKLKWAAGFEIYDIRPASVDIDRLNKGLDDDKKLPSIEEQPGLYERYQQWGLIPQNETDGGMFVGLKAGLVYDTRDFHPNPMKGIWTDMILYAAPKPFSDLDEGFMRLSITHRQYFTLVPKTLSFVYRLSYQGNLGTHVPFYAQPLMITTQLRGAYSEGLGGQRSLRGILRNRVVGEDFIYGNLEFRWKFLQTRLINQNFYLALNPFLDVGQVVRKIEIEDQVNLLKQQYVNVGWDNYFNFGSEKLHWTAGIGLKIVMNENFIISADYGKPFDPQDGKSGLYIGLNYLF